jgi:mannosyl-oligosaccharide alpha-1,2-mannosidase
MLSHHYPRAGLVPRFRRYRTYILSALIITVLLLQVSRNADWEAEVPSFHKKPVHGGNGSQGGYKKRIQAEEALKKTTTGTTTSYPIRRTKWVNDKGEQVETPPATRQDPPTTTAPVTVYAGPGDNAALQPTSTTPTRSSKAQVHTTRMKDRPLQQVTDAPGYRQPGPGPEGTAHHIPSVPEVGIHAQRPAPGQQLTSMSAISTIHWVKQKEWFPVPTESIIPLPTGQPLMDIPRIQHVFKEESDEEKDRRMARLSKVKGEMARAWGGYKEFAWGHDELKPLSQGFNDPFCGWAATLVDGLDTLWIMGFKKEFEEAIEAVKELDFTTTPFRQDIPVFETTIRYLGGLLGAYDVAGGEYSPYGILLDKAVELAEILMGVFDTPNRMPILYYMWKPAFASQPSRASNAAGVAEIGSLAMEFTRLAQLTGEDKYYDAVARITDQFEKLQNNPDGSVFPGIFPQQVDASGCNRTADMLKSATTTTRRPTATATPAFVGALSDVIDDLADPQGYTPGTTSYSTPRKTTVDEDDKDIEFKVTPDGRPGQPAKGAISGLRKRQSPAATDDWSTPAVDAPSADVVEPLDPSFSRMKEATRPLREATLASGPVDDNSTTESIGAKNYENHVYDPDNLPLGPNGAPINLECTYQDVAPGGWGFESYSMGGSQDSTYEYFPKQYLLLGGLVPKYKAMHEKVVAAVKKHLLYRPMTIDERDILFSAKIQTSRSPNATPIVEYEITHLTCFLGGMFAMGGRIFESEEDVEIGAKLADGCAWAYEIMPSGIMPEYAFVTPCDDMESCQWNATKWYDMLDPNSGWREEMVDSYYDQLSDYGETIDEILRMRKLRQDAETRAELTESGSVKSKNSKPKSEAEKPEQANRKKVLEAEHEFEAELTPDPRTDSTNSSSGIGYGSTREDRVNAGNKGYGGNSKSKLPSNEPKPLAKRQIGGEVDRAHREPVGIFDTDDANDKPKKDDKASQAIDRKVQKLEQELSLNDPVGRKNASDLNFADQKPLVEPPLPPPPVKPLTHNEFVQERLANEHLPPGFVTLSDRRYILR